MKKPVSDNLLSLFSELAIVKKQAEACGIFTGDRELLECPSCGLMEDVLINGVLITARRGISNNKDTSLRFKKIKDNIYKCPSCGKTVKLFV